MLFYCKKHLDYRPHVTPTYVLSREHEARREEEREREKEAARVKELDDELMEML
jgi:ubiquitin carboxyl-terminal hydrolase 22/27/51